MRVCLRLQFWGSRAVAAAVGLDAFAPNIHATLLARASRAPRSMRALKSSRSFRLRKHLPRIFIGGGKPRSLSFVQRQPDIELIPNSAQTTGSGTSRSGAGRGSVVAARQKVVLQAYSFCIPR